MHCRPIFPSVRFGSFRFRLKTYHRGTSRKVNMPFNDRSSYEHAIDYKDWLLWYLTEWPCERATDSHLFHFTGSTTPSHDKLSLASVARCCPGNTWRATCSEWASRDVTNALHAAGAGNDSRNVGNPKTWQWGCSSERRCVVPGEGLTLR